MQNILQNSLQNRANICRALLTNFLTSAVLAGCASQGKIQPVAQKPAEQNIAGKNYPAPAETLKTKISNGTAHGNMLSQWVDRTPQITSALPPAGEDCATIYDPVQHRIILVGGKNDEDKNLNEVWTLDLAKNFWQKTVIEGEAPPTSEDHTVIFDPVSYRTILYGGEDGQTTNKIWALDLKTLHWRNLTDSTAPRRETHTAVFDSHGKRMLTFGGRDNQGQFKDYVNIHEVWAFDLDPSSPTFEKWQDLTIEDNHPFGRADHVAVYDAAKNRMIIYGGWYKGDDGKEYLEDTWAYNFAEPPGKWKKIKTKRSHPPQRRHATGIYDSARNWFVIFGGFGDAGYLNDVWAFDLTKDAWINITPGPQPRIDHQAVYDSQNHRMVLYGGDAKLKGKFHDVWELQILPDIPLELLLKEAGAMTPPAAIPEPQNEEKPF